MMRQKRLQLQQRGHFLRQEMYRPKLQCILTGIKDRLDLVDDRVNLIWILSHIAPACSSRFVNSSLVDIHDIGFGVFLMNSSLRARLFYHYQKLDRPGFRLHRYEVCRFFCCCIGFPLSETISMTTSPARALCDRYERLSWSRQPCKGKTVRLGISTLPIIKVY